MSVYEFSAFEGRSELHELFFLEWSVWLERMIATIYALLRPSVLLDFLHFFWCSLPMLPRLIDDSRCQELRRIERLHLRACLGVRRPDVFPAA
ncbi:MAG: hypothetical protein C5B57_12220 [Blastocatellia bacterium]|nr:MAG: hypothetical protein C5B57_12220 [Blastocatellia bacterium]